MCKFISPLNVSCVPSLFPFLCTETAVISLRLLKHGESSFWYKLLTQWLNQWVEMRFGLFLWCCSLICWILLVCLQSLFWQANFCHFWCLKGSFPSLLLMLIFCYLQPLSNFTGSVDSHGTCQCSVSLPDTAFPADRVERLEYTAHILSQKFEREFSKVSIFFSNNELIYSKSLSSGTSRTQEESRIKV